MFVVDSSGSMRSISDEVVKVVDNQVAYLAKRSQEVNQETRVSVYLFNDDITCLIYDMDVMRLPSLRGHYIASGATSLIDANIKSIADLKKTPELYGDHAFLIYSITDGEENQSKNNPSKLKSILNTLPENWTVAVLVPNQQGVFEAKKFGFSSENISIWDATSNSGVQEAGRYIRESTDNFFVGRSKGIRGTKTLFKQLDLNMSSKTVKENLDELKFGLDYYIIDVCVEGQIRDKVENSGRIYKRGSAYYQLTKPETIQSNKQICIREKISNKIYSGQNARTLIGIPHQEVKVKPGEFGKFDIFVQSNSVNRKVFPGTKLVVLTNP